MSTQATLLDYLHARGANLPTEELLVLFLDARNRLLSDEVMAVGSPTDVAIYPREIVRRALELGASGLILAHNHPSGDPTPSEGDLDATKRIAGAAHTVEITLHDHVIVAKSGWFSLKAEGLL